MSLSTLAGKTATVRDAQTADLPDAIEGPYVPRSIPGGTVIEAQAFVRTDDGNALRFDGSAPVFVVGLCSEIKVCEALSEYSRVEIDRAIENGKCFEREKPANANEAVAAAESPEVSRRGCPASELESGQ